MSDLGERVVLSEAAAGIGRTVIYTALAHRDEGVILSVNAKYVFVRYATGSKTTRPEDLEWVSP